jgi:hypothetical protein
MNEEMIPYLFKLSFLRSYALSGIENKVSETGSHNVDLAGLEL